jgi:hypothetical protein
MGSQGIPGHFKTRPLQDPATALNRCRDNRCADEWPGAAVGARDSSNGMGSPLLI